MRQGLRCARWWAAACLAVGAMSALGCASDGAGGDDADVAPSTADPPDAGAGSDSAPVADSVGGAGADAEWDADAASVGDVVADGGGAGEPTPWVSDPRRMPRSIHVSWQRDPARTLTFTWTTTETSLEDYVPRVWIAEEGLVAANGVAGVLPPGVGEVFEGAGEQYQQTLFGIPTGDEMYVVHRVEVTGLEPRTSYVYRVGSWGSADAGGRLVYPNLSDAHVIATAPDKGDRQPFSFVMAGDSRGGTDEIVQHIDRFADIDAVAWFYNGDMTDGGTQPEWDVWWEAMSPLLHRRPLMSVQGNHEIFADLYYRQVAYPLLEELPEAIRERAWSLTIGNVHVIGLDSNDPAVVEQQVPWLDAELQRAKADPDVDWVVTMCHHAIYSASNHGSTSYLQAHWLRLFEAHSLDLSFAGHDHNYERTHPIRGGAVVGEGEGTTYVVAGGFFSPAYSNGHEWWTATSAHGDKRNYVVVDVDGTTLSITAYSGDGAEILDQHTFTK